MKTYLRLLIHYKLYMPLAFYRLLYINFFRIKRARSCCVFIPTRYAVLDIAKSANIIANHSILFGWSNMRYSRLETGLIMADDSILEWGGANYKSLELIGYGSYIQIGEGAKLSIGNSFINREVKIICNRRISIGDGCVIAMGTVIRDNDGGHHQMLSENYQNQKPITIENHVWIGENSMILKGVTIGEGAVIAASSLINKDVPAHCLVAGNPAKIIRENINWKR